MRKYLTEYLAHLEALLESGEEIDYDDLERSHLIMIEFMQHERLIHFLVTMLFSVCFFMIFCVFLVAEIAGLILLMVMILSLLIPYVAHYYFLENSVQKMYRLHDEIHARRMKQQKNNETV